MKTPTQEAIARKLGISRQTLHAWKLEGVDITSMKELRARLARMKEREASTEKRRGIAMRKLEAETRRAELKAGQEAGELLSMPAVMDAIVVIGSTVRASIFRLEADLPPLLEGMTGQQMKEAIAAKSAEILQTFDEQSAELLKSNP